MAVYALWNNKGGVGKSYLTFQLACEYARTHAEQRVLVVDLCPQANSSGMLLGGMVRGEIAIDELAGATPPRTISGYIADRIVSPYVDPRSGAQFVIRVGDRNPHVPENLWLVCGDEELEMQSPYVRGACSNGPADSWRIVHTWVRNLIHDIQKSWDQEDVAVFIDCNPSFTIMTELAMCASDRLLIPFSADASSKRAVRSVLSLVYGIQRRPGQAVSEFFRNATQFRMSLPGIYSYIGNRLTQYNTSASAFRSVVTEVFSEVFRVWQTNPQLFVVHPFGSPAPTKRQDFRKMYEIEINDTNTASVVSGALGIPMCSLTAGIKRLTKDVMVNQAQLDKQQPNIASFVQSIE